MQIDREWISDFAMGIHSNIPICCVAFFCNIWTPLYSQEDQRVTSTDRDFVDWDAGTFGKSQAQYVQCPDCFNRNHIVKIHECKPDARKCFLDGFEKALYPPVRARKKRPR